mgnify:CR=1 FL=1
MVKNAQNLNRRSFILSAGAGIASACGLLSACGTDDGPTTASLEDSPAVKEFERQANAFIDQNRTTDGEIYPKSAKDVYLMVKRFSFEPGQLRLDRNVAYRFRMMAADVPHGVWVKPSDSGPLTLTPGELYEHVFTFRKPGRYFITCSTYCGTGHDKMRATIQVV